MVKALRASFVGIAELQLVWFKLGMGELTCKYLDNINTDRLESEALVKTLVTARQYMCTDN